jgi:hypothetical protein
LDRRISAHKKVLRRFSALLHPRLTANITTISISEFSYASVHCLLHMIYNDCSPDLPRELASLIELLKVAVWLDIPEVIKKCIDSINVTAHNLRALVEGANHVPEVMHKTVSWVKAHLKEAAALLKPDQLVSILSA